MSMSNARGSGPLARPAAAITHIVIAFATLACLREQRASLAAHHSSPNCCHPRSTTPLPAKPDVHTAYTLTQPLSAFLIVVNRKRSNGKSTVAAFDPQTTQHASTGQPLQRRLLRFYAFTITFSSFYIVIGAACSWPCVASRTSGAVRFGDQQGSRSTAVSETAFTAWPASSQLCSHHTRRHDTL